MLSVAAPAAAEGEPLQVDCQARTLMIDPLPDAEGRPAFLRVALATDPGVDTACRP